jgi:chorismate synthase
MGNTLGRLFRITTWGESHGAAVGVVIDGCPPGVPLVLADIQAELDRRRPGQSDVVSPRAEPDTAEICAGVFEGQTLGTPIAIQVRNRDARPDDYEPMRLTFRPSHADYTYARKYGVRDWRGGGRASARETIGRVAAGAVAKRVLQELFGVSVLAWVARIGTVSATVDAAHVQAAEIEANAIRCPDDGAAAAMREQIEAMRAAGDSLGGVIEAVARDVPAGWGEPVFDKLEADLGKAILSIPACKAIEFGSGFAGTSMTGSVHNDPFYVPFHGEAPPAAVPNASRVRTRTNHSGGIQGGISNGELIFLRAGFKPTATIARAQETVTETGEAATLAGTGRHDPCVLPRATPIVEAMIATVLVDHALRQRGQVG